MRVAIAILIGLLIAGIGFGTLRGLARPMPAPKPQEATPVPQNARITWWCETCGTELLLLQKGSDAAPRHCGEHMIRREEIPRA